MVLPVDFNTGLEEEEEKEKKNPMGIILISIVSGVLISAFINGGVLLMARLKRRGKESTYAAFYK